MKLLEKLYFHGLKLGHFIVYFMTSDDNEDDIMTFWPTAIYRLLKLTFLQINAYGRNNLGIFTAFIA